MINLFAPVPLTHQKIPPEVSGESILKHPLAPWGAIHMFSTKLCHQTTPFSR